ncbi:MAG: hypothetical protein DRG59_03660 [Deltaproteobacteria bacterium]|nr:MAG: hypothetical protein DRG59_03660 [Deltaproteobacteria bacterium]
MIKIASEVIYEGVKIALKYLFKRITAKNKWLVVIANRESIFSDAKEFFKDHKVLFKYINQKFSLAKKDIEMLVDQVISAIDQNTKPKDVITIVLAGPGILYAFLADRLHHSSRFVFFTQYDLAEKTYRYYKVSTH